MHSPLGSEMKRLGDSSTKTNEFESSQTLPQPHPNPPTATTVRSVPDGHTPHELSHPRVRAVRAAMRKSRVATKEAMAAADARQVSDNDAMVRMAVVSATTESLIPPSIEEEATQSTRRLANPNRNSGLKPATSSSIRTMINAENGKPAWRPILYQIQPYEDNYVDDTFLSSLVTNANVRPLDYWQLCLSTCTLTQRICLLSLFLLLFYGMHNQLISIEAVLLLDGTALVGGLLTILIIQYYISNQEEEIEWRDIASSIVQRVLLLTLALLFLSPLLNTLTYSYSSDTIWALTFFLSLMHLLWFDYRWINEAEQGKREFDGTLSLNAGVFAAILLGSRLQVDFSSTELIHSAPPLNSSHSTPSLETPLSVIPAHFLSSSHVHCFGFILWSFIIFGGMTVASYWIRRFSLRFHVSITILLLTVCSLILLILIHSPLAPLPFFLLPLFHLTCFGINLVAPGALIYSQRYKNSIHGPWDYDDANEMESDNL